eukprot:4914996-Ditylum_brightwellii.AAC.1
MDNCIVSDDILEGNYLPVLPCDLGSCEFYPQTLMHICKGHFVAVCGNGEFIIYLVQEGATICPATASVDGLF